MDAGDQLHGSGHRWLDPSLYIFEFRDGLIARENAWLDLAAIQGQLAYAERCTGNDYIATIDPLGSIAITDRPRT